MQIKATTTTDGSFNPWAIIPHTYAATNLHTLKVADALNIETDVLARYAERRQTERAFTVTEAYLLENGY